MPGATDLLDDAVEQMLRGDEPAFGLVYRDVQPRLLRYLSTVVGDSDAEDIAAQTWRQATRELTTFSGRAVGFRSWITAIGRQRALDYLQARGRRPVLDSTCAEPPASAAPSERGTHDALRLIGSLPPEQAEAVLLRTVMGLDAASASTILGRRPRAVARAANRGIRTLSAGLPGLTRLGDTDPPGVQE